LINVISKELYNVKALILKTLTLMPLADEIKIMVFKPGLLNTNPKLVIVTQPIIKSKKLPDFLMFNKN